MTQPIQDPNMMQQSPVTGDMILALRREAMQKQGMQTDQSGAINRRMQSGPQQMMDQQSPIESGQAQDPGNPLEQGQSPTEIQLSDMQASQESQTPPPDINQTAAQVMMQYGAVLQFLQEAKGQIQSQ